MSKQKAPVSPVIEFIKVFYEMSARYGRSEIWYDYIDMHAIALANTCDLRCRDTREERYKAIVQKYDEKTVQQFAAQDIDPLACKMCYIQMCCIGVPGVVVVGNSLFPDAERAPTDFWFTHKYFALDEKALENTYQQTKE